MNVNDPIAARALANVHPEASPSEVDWQAWQTRYEDMDRAVIARIGGNEYRKRINANIRTQPGFYADERRMAEQDRYVRGDAESLAAGRSYLVGRYYGRRDPSPESPARFWGQDHIMSARSFDAPQLPESAFDWPIYRAAIRHDHNIDTCPDCYRLAP
jgi:hypothetical protein